MAHTAPPSSSRRGLELAFGFVLLLVGALVAVVAVVALHHPSSQQAASASEPKRSTGAVSSGTAAPRTTAPSSPAATGSAASSDTTAGAAAPATSAPLTPSTAGSGKLPLIVLNNTSTTPGSVAAGRFSQAGWTVTDVSTFDGAILSTAAYYDPNVAGAEGAATELQREFPAIQRVKPKFDGLPQGPIVVVLTSDYS